jgi:hypothetical protein
MRNFCRGESKSLSCLSQNCECDAVYVTGEGCIYELLILQRAERQGILCSVDQQGQEGLNLWSRLFTELAQDHLIQTFFA